MVEEELDKPGLETAGQPKPLAISGNTRQQFDGWKDQVCAYLYKKAQTIHSNKIFMNVVELS